MIIDAHGHVTAPAEAYAYQASLVASRGAPSGHRRAPVLSDDLLEAALQKHLDRLRDAHTDVQLISPRPFGMLHSLRPELVTRAWVPFVNDIIARHCQLHPDVFRGVCGLPQYRDTDPSPCVEELWRCVTELSFVGCLLNPDPVEGDGPPPPGLGSEFWYPVYQALVDLDVPALIHPASHVLEREPYTLHFINEETTAVWELAESSVFTDFPTLKIVVAHGGGAIPFQMGRFRAWRLRTPGAGDWDESVHRLYYDTCNYSKDALELLFGVMGPERCLFGTEMPGTGSALDPATGRMLDDLKPVIESIGTITEKDRQLVFEDNARRLYRLDSATLPAS